MLLLLLLLLLSLYFKIYRHIIRVTLHEWIYSNYIYIVIIYIVIYNYYIYSNNGNIVISSALPKTE